MTVKQLIGVLEILDPNMQICGLNRDGKFYSLTEHNVHVIDFRQVPRHRLEPNIITRPDYFIGIGL